MLNKKKINGHKVKFKMDWLVLRFGINGRFVTVNVPVPGFLIEFLIAYWVDVAGVLLLGSLISLASMNTVFVLPIYLTGMAFYAVLTRRLINDIKKDERRKREWSRVTLFAKNPALLEYIIVVVAGVLWPLTFFLTTFDEWFTDQEN